ncbi:unnamed protein product [Rhizophagus irregularis]|nr:unnamed protein product [Rhizophagus irregularis]
MLHITRYAFGSRVTSEVQEIQRFVQLSGDFRRMEIQRIRSALRFGSQVTSEEWKSKEFVRLSGDFRRMEKTKFRLGCLGWDSEETEYPKIRFFRFLGVGYIGFGFVSWALDIWVSAFGYWALDIWISAFGYWALDRSGFHFEFLVRFSFGLLLNGFLFWTFVR